MRTSFLYDNALNHENIIKDSKTLKPHYLNTILQKSEKYLKETFNPKQYKEFLESIKHIYSFDSTKDIVKAFEKSYYDFVKEYYQKSYAYDEALETFLDSKEINQKTHKDSTQKIIWGDCLWGLILSHFLKKWVLPLQMILSGIKDRCKAKGIKMGTSLILTINTR